MRHALQRALGARREPCARAGIARVDQDDAAATHVVIQRGRFRGRQRCRAGSDRPIQQRIEAQIGLARHHRVGLRQRRGGAAVDVVRQALQPGPRNPVHLSIAGQDIAQPSLQRRICHRIQRRGPRGAHPHQRHQKQHRQPPGSSRPRPAPNRLHPALQQPTQPQRDHQIQRQQHHRRRQQPLPDRPLRASGTQRLHGRAAHHRGSLRQRQIGTQVQRLPSILRPIQPRRVPRRDRRRAKRVRRQPNRGFRRRGQQSVAVQYLRRRQHGRLRRRRHPGRQRHQPTQHLHEQPRQRQIRPVGIGSDMEQHDPPGAQRRLGHQRRAVSQLRPGVHRQ